MSWAARNLAAYLDSGPSNTQITPGTGAVTVVGQPASVRPIAPAAAAVITVTGYAPTVRQEFRITPGTGSISVVGHPVGAASQSQIISKEYTGDGASTRSFNSLGFLPLFVIVVGKDGSGNVVGALKSPLMPAGESQPFEEGVAAGGASRLNRIISIDANGFTVGSDLNVTGRKYAYIMFPAGRFGAVTEGTYVGNTVSAPGHASLIVSATEVNGNPSGSTQFVKPQYCVPTWYRPAGSTPYTPGTPLILGGRRMIRTSDGAVLAEATNYINDSRCEAIGYIIGNEGNWYWEEQYIELHTLVPDLLLLVCDDSPGQGIPATVAPPPTDTAIGWSANSIGDPAFFASNTEAVLHVPDTNGLSYNLDGKRYHWYALKGDALGSGGVLMKTFQYTGTGDGPYPIDLVGCGFDPEWAYLQAANDQFHWSKRTTNIIGLHTSRRWLDGTGDHVLTNPAYTIDFITDGVQFPATNSAWNNLGVEYTVLLIGVSAPLETTFITPATGAIAVSGQQPEVRSGAVTPAAGSVVVTGQQATARTEFRLTPGTAESASGGGAGGVYSPSVYNPGVFKTSGVAGGSIQVVGYAPIIVINQNDALTPGAGAAVVEGQAPIVRVEHRITPGTGHCNVTGYPPAGGNVDITPGTGHCDVTGYPPIVEGGVTPEPPRPPDGGGGVGVAGGRPDMGKLPFWPLSRTVTCSVELLAPAAELFVRAVAEDEEDDDDELWLLR